MELIKMAKLQVLIHNTQTDEIINRDMTAAELKQYEANQEIEALRQAEAEAKATAKAAILDRIGLTADELKTILG
jgi:hypothetical protein